jgi:hypothetical protein
VAVIPANTELDLKALAAASGDRKVHLVPVKELQKLTGYIRGGVTALAAKKTYPVYVDETIELFEMISVSAGIRGTQILLAPLDFIRATKATVSGLARAGVLLAQEAGTRSASEFDRYALANSGGLRKISNHSFPTAGFMPAWTR